MAIRSNAFLFFFCRFQSLRHVVSKLWMLIFKAMMKMKINDVQNVTKNFSTGKTSISIKIKQKIRCVYWITREKHSAGLNSKQKRRWISFCLNFTHVYCAMSLISLSSALFVRIHTHTSNAYILNMKRAIKHKSNKLCSNFFSIYHLIQYVAWSNVDTSKHKHTLELSSAVITAISIYLYMFSDMWKWECTVFFRILSVVFVAPNLSRAKSWEKTRQNLTHTYTHHNTKIIQINFKQQSG